MGDNVDVGEPCIIRTDKQMYLLTVVNEPGNTYVELVEGGNLETVCRINLPEQVPYGFHGKWSAN